MPGMIVAPQPIAVEEGARVLMDGGNAIDAAVTSAFVQGIVSPQMCGVGGYLLLTAHLTTSPSSYLPNAIALDAPALAGSQVRADMWQDLILRPNPDGWGYFLRGNVNEMGYTSICTPGTVKGLAAMLERWGTISWAEALQPAIRVADRGFMVDFHLAEGWKRRATYPEERSLLDLLKGDPEARRIYLRADGAPRDAGDHLSNPDYANTLRALAARGADDFYHGELARRMSEDLAANGSFVTADDLAAYEVRDEEVVTGSYRGHAIATAPAPHGGPTLLAILNILEGYDLASMEHNGPAYIHLVSLAMKAAFADRNRYLGDPRFGDARVEWMTSKERAAEWRRVIDAGEPFAVTFAPAGAPSTTHVSVVDGHGNCVALTHSLGMSSGVITPGLGFMWNNSMVNFHPLPGHPNSIAPHKGRTTGMAPTVVYTNGRPFLVLGAPGASRIITAVAQVILNVLDFGMSVSDAVLAPRFDCQGDLIRCQARIPEFVCAEVRRKHPITHLPYSHGQMGLVHAIVINPETGKLSGAADPGAGGVALGVG